jgi:hypothetical protein
MRLWFIKTMIKVLMPKQKTGKLDYTTGKINW